MVAHGPCKTDGSGTFDEAVLELSPGVGQVHALMLVGIGQFAIAVGGEAIAVGERDQNRHGTRRIGRIDKIKIERIADIVFIDIGKVVDAWVV